MDSITQITLGAAIGEAFLGKKIGYRAAVWGAALGTLPDLDILANPVLDAVAQLQFHRGFTHSILFCITASPAFGWFLNRFQKSEHIGWLYWSACVFTIFATHIFIDVTTTYGTQILYPFSNIPVTTDTMFIIDPLYTVPLLLGLIAALFMKRSGLGRHRVNMAGIIISSLYIFWGFVAKTQVHPHISSSFLTQFGGYEMIKTTPAGPTTFLWNGYVIKNDTLYQTQYSIFDTSDDLIFTPIPRNSYLIEPYKHDRGMEALLWFSGEYYTVIDRNGSLIFYDLRFGRDDFWLGNEGEYVWGNIIEFNNHGNAVSFNQEIPSFSTRSQSLSRFWNRMWGQ